MTTAAGRLISYGVIADIARDAERAAADEPQTGL